MATVTEQAGKLLDFAQKLDITLLDNVVGVMYAGEGAQVGISFLITYCPKLIGKMPFGRK